MEAVTDPARARSPPSMGGVNRNKKWNLLTIPVSVSKASLKKREYSDYSGQFLSKDSIISWNLLAFFPSNGGNFPVALLE